MTIVKIGIYSLLVDLLLMALKFVLARLTGSLALHADAFHSLADVISSIVLIIGLAISGRKSRNFPYGLYKIENIVAIVISLTLFFTGYEIMRQTILGVEIPVHELWLPISILPTAVIPYLFSRYEAKIGRKFNSPSLIADASQFRVDVFVSSIVFIGVLGQSFGIPLDRIAAGVIAIFVGYSAWGLLIGSMRVLLDASVSRETVEKIKELIKEEPAVAEIENVIGRNSGRFIFIEAAIKLRVSELREAHLISQKIERKIKGTIANIDHISIHYGPQKKTLTRYAIPLVSKTGEISDSLGEAPFFAFVDLDSSEGILQQKIENNPYLAVEGIKGIRVAEFLSSYKPDVVVARENLNGRAPGYVFTAFGTDTAMTEAKTLDEFLGQFNMPGPMNDDMNLKA